MSTNKVQINSTLLFSLQAEEGKGRQTRGKKISYSESAPGLEDSEESEEDKKPKSKKKAKAFSDDDTEEEFEANDEVTNFANQFPWPQ